MTKAPEPLGTRFNKWTLIEYRGSNRHQMRMVLARCDCGREHVVILANLRAGVSTGCRSCGRGITPEQWEGWRKKILDFDSVKEIKRRISLGHPQSQLARDYLIGRQAIHNIFKNKAWAHVPWPDGYKAKTRKPRKDA